MTKEEFLSKLRKKISMLEQSEIDDIISEYEGFIDEKMASGMSEKEAVKSLGNIDEIARDLKSAYKINSDYSESNAKNIIDTAVEKTTNGIDIFIKSFENKDVSDVVKMIIKVFLLLILIRICKFPVDVLLDIADETFMLLGNTLGNFLSYTFSFIVNVIYFILAVMFFYKIFVDKIIGEDVIEEIKEGKAKNGDKNVAEPKKSAKKVVKEQQEEQELREYEKAANKKGFFDICSEIVLVFIKFIVFWIAFADIFFIVGMASALAVCTYLVIRGVTYFGPLLIVFALFIAGIAFLSVMIRFIFNARQKVVAFLITLISSIVIGGAGIGLFSVEIANTSIINELPENKIQRAEKEFAMEENLVISDNFITDYVVDEELKDTIKVEYAYSDRYLNFEPNTYVTNSTDYKIYHLSYNATWDSNSFKDVIYDLKKKKIYNIADNISITVKTSSKNIDILKNNYDVYRAKTDYEAHNIDLDELDEDDIESIEMR